MKANPKTLLSSIRAWGAQSFRVNVIRDHTQETQPLRAELFSADQMERHGRTLADSHQLTRQSVQDQLLDRLSDNEAVLVECARVLTATVSSNHRLTPAGEWLLDNFYLIDEQIRTAKRHLPQGYSHELPRLADGAYCRITACV